MENHKSRLEKAMENNEEKKTVKELFKDYESAYKRLRNPSQSDFEEYKAMYIEYLDYIWERRKEE